MKYACVRNRVSLPNGRALLTWAHLFSHSESHVDYNSNLYLSLCHNCNPEESDLCRTKHDLGCKGKAPLRRQSF